MAYFTQRVFLDYLDFQTGDERPLLTRRAEKDLRLKFDVLAFPGAQFFVAAPAIAKCHDTAYLLGRYDLLWATNRLRYVLDQRYHGNFSIYVEERIRKLQNSFHDTTLTSHFEYLGYTSPHWRAFFDGFLPNEVGITAPYASRVRSGDTCFREETLAALANDDFLAFLTRNTRTNANNILRIVEDKSEDRSDLFQRETIVRDIEQAESVERNVVAILHHELDGSFSRANAIAAGCERPSDVLGINGHRLSSIAKNVWITPRKNLFDHVRHLSPSQIVELSQQTEWRHLVSVLDLEIRKKYLDTKGNQHLINKKLTAMLPSRYFWWLHEVATMVIAYVISPVFGSDKASRCLSAIFTDAPTWILNYLCSVSNTHLTTAITEACIKIRGLSVSSNLRHAQPLSDYGLVYVADIGFVGTDDSTKTFASHRAG